MLCIYGDLIMLCKYDMCVLLDAISTTAVKVPRCKEVVYIIYHIYEEKKYVQPMLGVLMVVVCNLIDNTTRVV